MKVLGTERPVGKATDRRALYQRWSVRGLAVVAVTASVGLGLVAPGGAAAAPHPSARAHVAAVGTHYAVYQHLCSTSPKPGKAACMAIRRVPASQHNPNAQPYTVTKDYPVGPSGFGLTPEDFATAYGYNPDSAKGVSQIVAIVDAYDDPNIAGDLATFDANYGLAETATSFVKVGQSGSTTALPAPDPDKGWSGEEALDVETVRGVCHACTILLVETNSDSNANLQAGVKTAAKLGATEISNSYGGPEGPAGHASKAQVKKVQKAYNYKGVVVTASTGDDGWFSFDGVDNYPDFQTSAESPNIPSSLPQVVSVGGTELNLTTNAQRRSETVWNENGPADSVGLDDGIPQGASGGGCSNYFKAKGWQGKVAGYSKTGCGKMRLAADVSADADPNTGYDVYDTYDCGPACEPLPTNGWQPIGGTSLSSPLIAAMWALAGGSGDVDYPALSLYGHFTAKHAPLYDVTRGGNSWCGGISHTSCATDTNELTGGAASNPNFLSLGGVDLGTLDCGFKPNTASTKAVKHDAQCNAGKGYDGPTGVGTPNGLTAFKALSPKAKIKHTKAKVKTKVTFSVGGSDPFPGGKFTKFHWVIAGKKARGATPTVVFKKSGKYVVRVSATDNYGRSATTSTKVKVKKK